MSKAKKTESVKLWLWNRCISKMWLSTKENDVAWLTEVQVLNRNVAIKKTFFC